VHTQKTCGRVSEIRAIFRSSGITRNPHNENKEKKKGKNMSATATEKATAATGMVTWRRHLPGANAIRVSYSNGLVLGDWILVEELPELKSDWLSIAGKS